MRRIEKYIENINDKNVKYNVKLFPIYYMFAYDFLFFYAIEFVFYYRCFCYIYSFSSPISLCTKLT